MQSAQCGHAATTKILAYLTQELPEKRSLSMLFAKFLGEHAPTHPFSCCVFMHAKCLDICHTTLACYGHCMCTLQPFVITNNGLLIKVVLHPGFSRSTNLESKLINFFVFLANSLFWKSSTFTVPEIGDFPSFLSALESNDAFIIKMWPGRIPDVVVGTLKVSLDQLFFSQRSLVECCVMSSE